MLIKCRYCLKEFIKPSHRNQHEKDAHKSAKSAMTKQNQPEQPVSGAMTDAKIRELAHKHLTGTGDHCIVEFARALLSSASSKDAIRNAALEEAVDVLAGEWLGNGEDDLVDLVRKIRALQSAPAQNGERPDGISPAAYDRLHALCESQAARIIELEVHGNAQEPVDFQIREIGEGGWRRVSKEQMEAAVSDPRIDYRVLYAAAPQSDAQQSSEKGEQS